MTKLKKESRISFSVKKNLLDLEHNKYLQYFNTTIIVIFTYVVGLALAFITKQINYENTQQIAIVSLISLAFFLISTLLLLRFKENLNKIYSSIQAIK